jgi:hypothetical protein
MAQKPCTVETVPTNVDSAQNIVATDSIYAKSL